MKKTIWKALCLCLALLLLTGMLASCFNKPEEAPSPSPDTNDKTNESDSSDTPSSESLSPEEKNKVLAFQLYQKVNTKTDSLSSYTQRTSMNMTAEVYGMDMTMSGENVIFVSGKKDNNYAYYTESHIHAKMETDGYSTTMSAEEIEGFRNGNMFYSYYEENDDIPVTTTQLRSSISASDYQAYLKQIEEGLELSAETCAKASCKQNTDGTWTATYSGLSRKIKEFFAIDTFTEMLDESVLLQDIEVTLTATADYQPMSIDVSFTFAHADPTDAQTVLPVLTAAYTYTDFNTTDASTDMDFSDYVQVEDLRAVGLTQKALEDRLNADSGQFNSTMESLVSMGTYSEGGSFVASASFSNQNGQFSYTMTTDDSDVETLYQYQNNVLTWTENGYRESMDYTDALARSDIEENMNPAGLTMQDVLSVTVLTDTASKQVYRFALANSDYADEVAAGVGGTVDTFNTTLTVTFENGMLTKYEYDVGADIHTTAGLMYFEINTLVEHFTEI